MVVYEGIFFDDVTCSLIHTLEPQKLAKPIANLHCTFKYHPEESEIFEALVGQDVCVLLTGYACDGKNSGFSIAIPSQFMRYYLNFDKSSNHRLTQPHITVSLDVSAKAVETKNLNFMPLKKPIEIRGKFGYFVDCNGVRNVSYEPYLAKRLSK